MKYILIIATLFIVSCNSSTSKKESKTVDIGVQKKIAQTPLEQSIERGSIVYREFCAQCHRPKGNGVGRSYPPLAGSDWLTDKRTESIHAVKYGLNGPIEVIGEKYNNVMAPMGLSDKEIADVMNYTMNTWGNTQKEMVTVKEVAAVEK